MSPVVHPYAPKPLGTYGSICTVCGLEYFPHLDWNIMAVAERQEELIQLVQLALSPVSPTRAP